VIRSDAYLDDPLPLPGAGREQTEASTPTSLGATIGLTMQQYRIKRPPRALRQPGVRLDNVALVPASLLPFKKEWQAVANQLPQGSVLLCSTSTNRRQRRILEQVSTHMKNKGHRVRTLPAEDFTEPPAA
jgi:hypothetical protein